jgi:hypothetical protein
MSKARRWGDGVSEATAPGEVGGEGWTGGTAGRWGRVAGVAGVWTAAAASGVSSGARAISGLSRCRFRTPDPVISPFQYMPSSDMTNVNGC